MLKIAFLESLNFLTKSGKISYFSGIGNFVKLGVLAANFFLFLALSKERSFEKQLVFLVVFILVGNLSQISRNLFYKLEIFISALVA
jgi:hypothetical protein